MRNWVSEKKWFDPVGQVGDSFQSLSVPLESGWCSPLCGIFHVYEHRGTPILRHSNPSRRSDNWGVDCATGPNRTLPHKPLQPAQLWKPLLERWRGRRSAGVGWGSLPPTAPQPRPGETKGARWGVIASRAPPPSQWCILDPCPPALCGLINRPQLLPKALTSPERALFAW